jgi:uncharacterized membrane protein
MAVIARLSGGFAFSSKLAYPKLDLKNKALFIIPLFFPLLSILGMHLMNTTDNNEMTMALLLLIPSYVILISLCHSQIPENAYPTIIFLFSISLILLWGMRSSHIIGTDAHLEYIFFKQTFLNERWQILHKSTLDSCLSISILPTIYQSILNVDSEYLFKILYPLLFSISPLVVYLITKNYFSSFSALLASVFFMSQNFFIITTASPRTNIAILFFALAILVLLHSGISEVNKKILFITFILSCIVSHYSTTYVFFIIFLITWVSIFIYRLVLYRWNSNIKIIPHKDKRNNTDSSCPSAAFWLSKSHFTRGILTIFFVMLFLWYSQVTGAPFDRGVEFITETVDNMQNFFIIESRDSGVSAAFGSGLAEKGLLSKIIFVICWLPIILIAFGVTTTLARHLRKVGRPYEKSYDFPDFLYKKLDMTFFILGLVCSAMMVAIVALPYASKGYDVNRLYLQVMVVLSAFLILGGLELARFFSAKRSHLILLAVIIPYFILNTGALSNIVGEPTSIILNSHGTSYDFFFIHEQETKACKWLGERNEIGKNIYADTSGRGRLMSQGMIPMRYIGDLVGFLQGNQELNGYIYLRYYNIVEEKISASGSTEIPELFTHGDRLSMEEKIYENGGSDIFKSTASQK